MLCGLLLCSPGLKTVAAMARKPRFGKECHVRYKGELEFSRKSQTWTRVLPACREVRGGRNRLHLVRSEETTSKRGLLDFGQDLKREHLQRWASWTRAGSFLPIKPEAILLT